MRIGVNVVTNETLDVALIARRAEELGFESLWIPEHPIIPVHTTSLYDGANDGSIPERMINLPDPFVGLARASAVTRTIKLGTGVCLVPERNPLLLAKEVATLDHLSGGRFIFGIGAGWLKEEAEIMGGNFPHRWSHTREAVLAMKELWTKDESEYHGKYVDFPPVRCYPKPVQKPYPPIYLGGYAKNVFKRVAEWGDGWYPIRVSPEQVKSGRDALDDLAAQMGRDPKSIDVTVSGLSGDPDQIKRFEEAGADGVTVQLPNTVGEEALAGLEKIAEQALR